MSKFTSGPWLIEYNNDTGPNDDFLVEWLEVGPARVYYDRAEVLNPVAMANAKLIAAAPDLLEALEAATDCGMVPITSANERGASRYARQVVVADMIRAAIARARGEA